MSKNLWGSMPDMASVRTPPEIVLEQGVFLAQATDGLLEIKLERKQQGALFSYQCYINVPVLKYRQAIFRITHDIKLFPSIIHHEQTGEQYTAGTQEEFEADLGSILDSKETKLIITGLMAQARLERDSQ